jgi:hypothetical protein
MFCVSKLVKRDGWLQRRLILVEHSPTWSSRCMPSTRRLQTDPSLLVNTSWSIMVAALALCNTSLPALSVGAHQRKLYDCRMA